MDVRDLDPDEQLVLVGLVKAVVHADQFVSVQESERIAELMLEKKGLNANVDFYSATVYYSLGIPTDLFTPIFAIARTAGWTAQVLEQLANNRLIRPSANYVGPEGLKVTPIADR